MLTDSNRPVGPIKTFIILDLETTAGIKRDHFNPLHAPLTPGRRGRDTQQYLTNLIRTTNASEVPHVLEICLISVPRNAVLGGIESIVSRTVNDDGEEVKELNLTDSYPVRLPCNIHTCQVKPCLSEQKWAEYEQRRLQNQCFVYSRDDLKDKQDFVAEWKGVRMFLENAPKPACILAHNGIKFDFLVIHNELRQHDLLETSSIPDQVYFVDSYLMFVDLEKKLHDDLRTAVQVLDWSRLAKVAKSEDLEGPNVQEVQETVTVESTWTDSTNNIEKTEKVETSTTCVVKSPSPRASLSVQKRPARRRLFPEVSDDHPLQYIRTSQLSPAKRKRIRTNFFQRSEKGQWMFNNQNSQRYFTERGVFKLESMYKQLTNRSFSAHYAQDDCEALLQVCLAYGKEFVDYVDACAVKFPY